MGQSDNICAYQWGRQEAYWGRLPKGDNAKRSPGDNNDERDSIQIF